MFGYLHRILYWLEGLVDRVIFFDLKEWWIGKKAQRVANRVSPLMDEPLPFWADPNTVYSDIDEEGFKDITFEHMTVEELEKEAKLFAG